MMTFQFFAAASTKWLRWPKDRTSLRDRLGGFCDSHTSTLFCVTCYQWHSVEQLFQWKLWTKILTTLVKRRRSYKVHITVYICLPDTTSQIFHWKPCQTLFLSFDRNKTRPQTSKTSEQRLASSLAERWTITEIRPQSNSVLTYSLFTDVLPL